MNKKQNKLACTVRKNVHFSRFAKISGIALFVVAAFCLLPPAPTVDNEATAATTYLFSSAQTAPTLSLTTDKSAISITANPTSTLATGKVTNTVSTTNYAGYKLTANLSGTSTNLTHSTISSKNIPSITSTYTSTNFPTGYWGVSLDGTNYQALPASNATALQLKNQTAAATNQTVALTVGVKVNQNQANGNYTNTINLTATANAASYTITYDKNTTDTVSNLPSAQTGTVSASAVALSSNTPTRTGYTFLGWSESSSATSATFAKGASVYFNQTQNNSSIKLYAVWKINTYTVTLNVASASSGFGSVNRLSLTVNYGSAVSTSGAMVIVAGTATTATAATATAQYSYAFKDWTNGCGATVTGNCTISANFTRTTKNYTVTWNANGGSVSPVTTTKAYGTTLGTLPTPTDSARVFQGWFTAASGGIQISANTTVTGDATYYAHWKNPDLTDLTYMQDVTLQTCASTPFGTQTQLLDSRDNKLYWVAKLADGNCWMTQNLDYDIKATGNIISNNDGTTSTWSPSTATNTTIFNSTTATDTYSYDYGDKYMPNGTDAQAQANIDCSLAGNENCHYHMGNLYQFNAATAGSGGTNKNYADASSSICPAGWRLPTSNSYTNDYSLGKLTNIYGITNGADGTTDAAMLASPLYFIRTGSLDGGTLTTNGNYGNYWTSTTSSTATGAYSLYIRSTYTIVNHTTYRYQAYAVRCVAIMDPTLNDISTMQEITPSIVAKTPENTSKQLIDARDNKLYWVTKLKDGNIWMTQNLDFDITPTNVTPELSDVTSAWNSSSTYAPKTTLTGTDYTQHFTNTENTATYSYDPGDYYWNGNWISGSNSAAGLGDSKYNTIMSTIVPAIAGEHYHVGNYYQWNAATAGTGGTITNKDATSSICPKGWRLPTGGSSSGNYSLNKLISSASITTSASLPAAPFFFTATGNIVNNVITDPGYGSYYWTSSAYSTTQHAYNLFFDSTNIYGPSGVAYNHYFGFPIRCVAKI